MRCLHVMLSLWLMLPLAADAAEGIRRCVGADGGTIYTDRDCASLDAVDSKPRRNIDPRAASGAATGAQPGSSAPVRSDCARRADTLLFDLRRAIEGGNVNHLAGVYHWPGTSGRSARYIMDRLQKLASRPRASVELVFPEVTPVRDDPDAFPPGTPAEDPIGIQVIETAFDDSLPLSDQRLSLVRNAGCWWISF